MKRELLAALAGLVLAGCATGGPGADADAPKRYAGDLVAHPATLAFEATRVGCHRAGSLELENAAPDHPIRVERVVVRGAPVRFWGPAPFTLGPGERRALAFYLGPREGGALAGSLEVQSDEGGLPLQVPIRAVALERPPEPTDWSGVEPLDLVLVLDVSTSMSELARLRTALIALFDLVAAERLDVRFGLTTFVNDVVVHRGGALLDRTALLEELDAQLLPGTFAPDPERPRQLLDFDRQENALEALYRTATESERRPGARSYLLLVTDDGFLEPPATFSDGTPAIRTLEEVASALEQRGTRLFSVHASRRGRGLSAADGVRPSLVARTGGEWFELADVADGAPPLDRLLRDLLTGSPCPP